MSSSHGFIAVVSATLFLAERRKNDNAPDVRKLVRGCRVEVVRKRTSFHRKLTPLPPGPHSPFASGQVVRSEKCGPVASALK